MNKLNLNNVTLVCIDDKSTDTARDIVKGMLKFIDFADVKIFASSEGEHVTRVAPIDSISRYNEFIIKELHEHIQTPFMMIVQVDGYPINFKAWTPEFLEYDYIGAPWIWAPLQHRTSICPTGGCVGNGGFSIRSKKLMEMVACEFDYQYYNNNFKDHERHQRRKNDGLPEDQYICREINKELKEKGIKFAPCELAKYFSVENAMFTGQFGFHGRETLRMNQKMNIFGFKEHAYE